MSAIGDFSMDLDHCFCLRAKENGGEIVEIKP
jgi:hypothetical protein